MKSFKTGNMHVLYYYCTSMPVGVKHIGSKINVNIMDGSIGVCDG